MGKKAETAPITRFLTSGLEADHSSLSENALSGRENGEAKKNNIGLLATAEKLYLKRNVTVHDIRAACSSQSETGGSRSNILCPARNVAARDYARACVYSLRPMTDGGRARAG